MLSKTNLKTGILSRFNIQLIRNNDWRLITKNNILHLEKAFYGGIFSDNPLFIENFLDKLYNREYSSILCGGLGLGVAPFMCQSFCDTIDVIEIDTDLITLINTTGYLPSKVNIIHGDFFTYEPQQKYDVILADIWQNEFGDFKKEVDIIIEKYTPYINDGGLLYLPLKDSLEKSCNC